MSQETLVKSAEATVTPEIIVPESEVLDVIVALDANPQTIATGDVRYEWGTINGKRIEATEASTYTIDNIVTTFGHDSELAATRRIQEVSVILAKPPGHILGIDGHVVERSWNVVMEGTTSSYFESTKVFRNNRTSLVRRQLITPAEISELKTEFNSAYHEIEGLQ